MGRAALTFTGKLLLGCCSGQQELPAGPGSCTDPLPRDGAASGSRRGWGSPGDTPGQSLPGHDGHRGTARHEHPSRWRGEGQTRERRCPGALGQGWGLGKELITAGGLSGTRHQGPAAASLAAMTDGCGARPPQRRQPSSSQDADGKSSGSVTGDKPVNWPLGSGGGARPQPPGQQRSMLPGPEL